MIVSKDKNGTVQEVSLFSNGTRYDRGAARTNIDKARAGLTGDFAEQGANSPYSAEFSPNWLQKIGEWFGDYSARDAFYQSQDQAEMERINSLLEAQRQQDYDSPAAQAARARAAGMNPDLVGTEGVESAAQVAPDETPPNSMGDLNQQAGNPVPVASLISTALGDPLAAIASCMSMAGMIQDLGIKQNQKTWMEVENYLGLNPAMQQFIAATEGDPGYGNDPLSTSGYDAWRQGRLQSSFATQLNHSGLSKSAKNLLKDLYSTGKYDKNGKFTPGLQLRQKALENQVLSENATKVGFMNSPGFSMDIMEWASKRYTLFDKFQNEAVQAQARLNARLAKVGLYMNEEGIVLARRGAEAAGLGAVAAEAKYNREYYQNLDPGLQSGASNAESTDTMVRSQLKAYYSALEKQGEAMHTAMLESISKSNMSPGAKIAARLAENKRHSEWRANYLHTRESSVNQALDKALGNVVDKVTE